MLLYSFVKRKYIGYIFGRFRFLAEAVAQCLRALVEFFSDPVEDRAAIDRRMAGRRIYRAFR